MNSQHRDEFISLDDWGSYGTELGAWLQRVFSPEVLKGFNDTVRPDWLRWLDEEQSAVDGVRHATKEIFERHLRARYRGVRVFHATRLPDLDGIREHGLRAWSADELRSRAIAAFPEWAGRDALVDAIREANAAHRGGRIYSFASLNHALRANIGTGGRIPAFAAFGGEFLGAVGNRIRSGRNGEIPQPGRGYFLACDLPWDLLESGTRAYLVEHILHSVIVVTLLDSDRYNMFGSWECISTCHDIPAAHITLYADVEGLVGREDLSPTDIQWHLF